MVESSLLDEDPVLFESASYWECRRRAREIRARWYADILDRARRLSSDPLFDAMQALLPGRQDVAGPDLFFGRTFSAWINALAGVVRKVERGLDPICLDLYCDGEAFERDLAAEYPHQGLAKLSAPFELVDGTVAVVPVHELARSPHILGGVRLTFPNVDWANTPFDRRAFELGVRHIAESLAALRKLSEGAYRSFKDSVHSVGLHVLADDETSTSSRASWPGCIMMGVSRQLLERNDVPFTASLLYHEHAHNKLALYLSAQPAGLDPAEHFVSPFKNTCRSAEVILHQIYPITMECAVRLALMGSGGRDVTQALDHLAATAFRMELLVGFLPLIAAGAECQATVDKLAALTRTVLAAIHRRASNAAPELARGWALEQARVHERHVWDIGQSLVRGAPVRDPGLDSWRRDGDRVSYVYRGVERTAVFETAGYGSVESRYRALDR
ncbi:MAG TPA: hypothetical protein VHT91_11755 [Kofleriaceae bacterium]|jgi:hypothetical protein|nr:hypothetical protein [Kofleriaceae bacterium]